jgi:hypothetical protein
LLLRRYRFVGPPFLSMIFEVYININDRFDVALQGLLFDFYDPGFQFSERFIMGMMREVSNGKLF